MAYTPPIGNVVNFQENSASYTAPIGNVVNFSFVSLLLKYWDNSQWLLKPLKQWTGAAWQSARLKRWSGSSWV